MVPLASRTSIHDVPRNPKTSGVSVPGATGAAMVGGSACVLSCPTEFAAGEAAGAVGLSAAGADDAAGVAVVFAGDTRPANSLLPRSISGRPNSYTSAMAT